MKTLRFSSRHAAFAATILVVWQAGCSTPPQPAPKVTPTAAWPPASASGTTSASAAVSPGAAASAAIAASAPPSALPGPAHAPNTYAWSPVMDDTSQRLRTALQGSDVTITQTTDQRIWLSLPVEAAFPKGRSAVTTGAAASLDQIALALRSNARAQIQIVSDADAKDTGPTSEALALDRAASARDWIVGRGILASRVVVARRDARPPAQPDAHRLDILIGERSATPH